MNLFHYDIPRGREWGEGALRGQAGVTVPAYREGGGGPKRSHDLVSVAQLVSNKGGIRMHARVLGHQLRYLFSPWQLPPVGSPSDQDPQLHS